MGAAWRKGREEMREKDESRDNRRNPSDEDQKLAATIYETEVVEADRK